MNAKDERWDQSHVDILGSARRILRERGISGMKVAEVMKGAGLTVGGFYAHFGSKEALVDETLKAAAGALRERMFARLEDKPAEARLEVVLKRYLSTKHRDRAEEGCPFPAVVGEVATTAPEHAESLERAFTRFAAELEAVSLDPAPASRRTLALGLFALMYGGLTLARAVKDRPLSDEILKAARALGIEAIRRANPT